jgi:hypothetical protein
MYPPGSFLFLSPFPSSAASRDCCMIMLLIMRAEMEKNLLKEAQQSDEVSQEVSKKEAEINEQTELKPQGIGMAVAFDWGLVVQLLVTPFLTLLLGESSVFQAFKLSPVMTALVSWLISLPFAVLIAIFGEGVRRGWRWTRPLQVGFNALAFFGGFYALYNLWQDSKHGNYWSVVTATILLIFSPLIAWRLSRPVTKQWFATVKSGEARKRHGGFWPWLILIWSIIGGVLQAIAATISTAR